jgi:hypothetical protein
MKKLSVYFTKNFSSSFIVFFRISIGLIVLIHFLYYWQDFELLYTNKSIVPIELHSLYRSYNIITIDDILNTLNIYFSHHISVLIFKFSYIVLSFCVIVGFFSRISSILLIFLQISFIKYGSLLYYGADFFTTMSLFYIFLFPSSSYFSLQKKFFPKSLKFVPNQSLTLCKRLIQIHLCVAYFFSGFDKILGFNWWNGESIWKAIHLPNFNHFIDMGSSISNPLFYVIVGWFTIIIEMLYPLFINIQSTRKIWLYSTIGMHIGIVISFNLFFFSTIMITWNLTSYYFNYEKYNL